MSSADFLASVVSPNVEALIREPDNYRAAINAILSFEPLVGLYYLERKTRDATLGSDSEFRGELARQNEALRLIRDLAASLKHGELTTQAKRTVRLAADIKPDKTQWNDDAVWNDNGVFCDNAIVIEYSTEEVNLSTRLHGLNRIEAYSVAREARDFMNAKILGEARKSNLLSEIVGIFS
ncbi:hypothetical protein [Shimia sp.]|uniref:hypothetical protein n=1 Tax=Shimia sp. TaxID=1954381 RepID=UPI0035654391